MEFFHAANVFYIDENYASALEVSTQETTKYEAVEVNHLEISGLENLSMRMFFTLIPIIELFEGPRKSC